jgi:hypothetical protein
VLAHEFVALQSGGNPESGGGTIPAGLLLPIGAYDPSHATQIDGLLVIPSQRDYVLDGTGEIRLRLGAKKHPAGAYVIRAASQVNTRRAGTYD